MSNLDYQIEMLDAGRYSDGKKILNHLNKYYAGKSIDLAIVTHCDEDHFGGFVYLLEQVKIERIKSTRRKDCF